MNTKHRITDDTDEIPKIEDFSVKVVPIALRSDGNKWYIWRIMYNDEVYFDGTTVFSNFEDACAAGIAWVSTRFDYGDAPDKPLSAERKS